MSTISRRALFGFGVGAVTATALKAASQPAIVAMDFGKFSSVTILTTPVSDQWFTKEIARIYIREIEFRGRSRGIHRFSTRFRGLPRRLEWIPMCDKCDELGLKAKK